MVLLGAFSYLGVYEGFLLFRVLLYLQVTSSPMVGWVVGRGCCGMWVSGVGWYRCGPLFICRMWYDRGEVWVTERDSCFTIFFRAVGWGPKDFEVYFVFLIIWTGWDNCVAVVSWDSLLFSGVYSVGLCSGGGSALFVTYTAVVASL